MEKMLEYYILNGVDPHTREISNELQEAKEKNKPTIALFLRLLHSDLITRPAEWIDDVNSHLPWEEMEVTTWDAWAETWIRNDILDQSSTKFVIALIKHKASNLSAMERSKLRRELRLGMHAEWLDSSDPTDAEWLDSRKSN